MTSLRPDDRPAFQFYVKDWLAEPTLRLVGLAERGLWIDMLCIMFRAENRGYLEAGGSRIGSKGLARMVGASEAEVKQSLDTLQATGVCSTTDTGTIYSRRMVRDEKLRQSKAEAGRKGGLISRPKAESEAKGGSSVPSPSSSPTSTPTPLVQNKPARLTDEEWKQLWKAYPKKVGKAEARQECVEIVRKGIATASELLEATKNYAAYLVKNDRFSKDACTFFRPAKRRWEDFTDGVPQEGAGGKQPKDYKMKDFHNGWGRFIENENDLKLAREGKV